MSSSPSAAVHRLRFIDWSPSRISALAFAPCPKGQRGLLAVGRENGAIDLCVWTEESGMAKGWVVDTTLVGAADAKVDSLAFVLTSSAFSASGHAGASTARLFSTSGGSGVTEHFLPSHLLSPLSRSSPRGVSASSAAHRTLSSGGGAIWSLAASPLGRYLALGCEDGVVRIVDIAEGRFEHLAPSRAARRAGDGTLRGIVPRCDRAKTRVVALAWGPPRRVVRQAKQAKKKKDEDDSSEESSDDSDDDEDDEEWEETFLVGGTSSSLALQWDLQTGRVAARLNVDRSRSEHTVVWAVLALPSGCIVLADSLGKVTFYDGATHVALPGASFGCHARGADVLCLTAGPDGKSVYAGSVDTKVSEYALVGEGNAEKWIHTTTRKLHAHDVRTLAVSPSLDLAACVRGAAKQGNEKKNLLPILVSGGNDFSLVLTPASPPSELTLRGSDSRRKRGGTGSGAVPTPAAGEVNPISTNPLTSFAETTQRRLPYVPATSRGSALSGGSAVVSAAGKRWLALRRERSVGIWALPARAEVAAPLPDEAAQAEQQGWRKVLEMEMRFKSALVALALSADGRWLAVGDLYETKLFALRAHGEAEELNLEPRRERSLGSALASSSSGGGKTTAPAASALAFTPDSSRLVLASYPGSFLHILELPSGGNDACRLLQSFAQHRSSVASSRATAGRSNGHAASGSDDDSDVPASSQRSSLARIDLLSISGDSQYLLSIDSERRVHTFNLDVLSAHRSLPSPSLLPSSAVFAPAVGRGAAHVALVLPSNETLLYDVESARGVHAELNSALAPSLGRLRDHAVGAAWLPSGGAAGRTLVLWGATWLCTARLLASPSGMPNGATPRKRRSTTDEASPASHEWSVKVTHRYQPLLFVDALPRAPPAAAGGAPMDAPQSHQQQQADEYCAELVVVERPFFALARSLPPAFKRAVKYGA